MKKKLFVLLLLTSSQVFSHGWQTLPLTRTEYLNQTDRAAVGWEPQSVASNLTGSGNASYTQIINFPGGPLGFFRQYHAYQGKNLCSNGNSEWPRLLEPLPNDKVTKLADGQQVNFAWTKTAPHTPSNHFTFITNYKPGAFNATPTWQDLNYLPGCDATGSNQGTPNYSCKLQLPNQTLQGKQVIVSIWQRVDAAAENFVSCADVEFDGSSIVTPGWTPIESKSWVSAMTSLKANELVTFKLTKNNMTIATYSLSITGNNLSKWDSILAAKINNDTSLNGLAVIGGLNTLTGAVTYDENNRSKNYVYINKAVSDSNAAYGYSLTKQADPIPVTASWSVVGYKLNDWLKSVKTGDKLSFALNKNGIETDTISGIVMSAVADAEKDLATAINNHTFKNGIQVKAGVLTKNSIEFVSNGENLVYVYQSSDSTDEWSFVVRNITPTNQCNNVSTWMNTAVYTTDNQVTYEEVIYKARWWTQGENPKLNHGKDGSGRAWGVVSSCSETPAAPVPVAPKPGNYPTYPNGASSFTAGSLVYGTDGNLYECKPWPYSGWCQGAAWAYAPGTGSAWQSAWIKR